MLLVAHRNGHVHVFQRQSTECICVHETRTPFDVLTQRAHILALGIRRRGGHTPWRGVRTRHVVTSVNTRLVHGRKRNVFARRAVTYATFLLHTLGIFAQRAA